MTGELSDPLEPLLSAVKSGDVNAFHELYRRTAPKLLGIAFRIVKRRDLAEDVLQDAFISIWRKAESFDAGRGMAISWMSAIVRYRAIDIVRSKPVTLTLENDVRDTFLDEKAEVSSLEGNIALVKCLKQLKDNHHKAILLAFYFGLSHGELAEKLSIPLGTAKSWIRRGLLELRGCLEA